MSQAFKITDGVLEKYEGKEKVVVIPDGVTKIGRSAFEGNKTLTEVAMPDTVTEIGRDAFARCAKLKQVHVSAALEEIGTGAFEGCGSLTELELPNTLRHVGWRAFADCGKLRRVVCASEVYEPGSDPFTKYSGSCAHLADEQGFVIFCGVLFSYFGTAEHLVIPEGVKCIRNGVFKSGTYSFEKKQKFVSAVIPDSVKEIGDDAFRDCAQLQSLVMPSGIEIGQNAFAGCTGLADENGFVVHDGVALVWCADEKTATVPDGVRALGQRLFEGSKISSVQLPSTLERIGEAAFRGCKLLEHVTIPANVREICSSAFADCEKLTDVVVPDTVETMGNGVFAGCRGLADEQGFVMDHNTVYSFFGSQRDITIPEGITAISDGVFNKTAITSVQLPSTLTELGAAFTDCDLLTEIEIPEGVTELHRATFSGCKALRKVTLPQSLTSIGASAFAGCEALAELSIPSGVTAVGDCAFHSCAALTEIDIPDGVTTIDYRTFLGCKSLRRVRMPAHLKEIGFSAFEGCESLEEITLPETIATISGSAFEGCTRLRAVHAGKLNAEVSSSAFDKCPSLADENGFTILGDVLWKSKSEHAVIPEGITQIAPNAFREGIKHYGRSVAIFNDTGTLKSVVLPSTLKTICSGAFAGCNALTEIDLPDGVETIGSEAFAHCAALASVRLPAELKAIESDLFSECGALKKLSLPPKVASVELSAFADCTALEEIEVDAENVYFSSMDGMLMNKAGDTLLYVPAGKHFKSYTIPAAVSAIGTRAFTDCVDLKKIVIPETVTTLGDQIFPRNVYFRPKNLKDIEIAPQAGAVSIGRDIFDFSDEGKPLCLPKFPPKFASGAAQSLLALGYLLHPEKYEGAYAEAYRQFAASHEKTLKNKAKSLGIALPEPKKADEPNAVFKPNLTAKRPSEKAKVDILEETVCKGTAEDLKDVLETYKTFEITARALGLAARYRGVAFLQILMDHGATFRYSDTTSMRTKYHAIQRTAGGEYSTLYYLMVVPEKLDLTFDPNFGAYGYDYSPMTGVSEMGVTPELEKQTLPMAERLACAKFLIDHRKRLSVSADELLFWAITTAEIPFADALMDMGVTLDTTPPSYYSSWGDITTYLEMITEGGRTVYWTNYLYTLSELKKTELLPVLERLQRLASAQGKQILISQKLFDEAKWNDASLTFVLRNADVSKINQKKALEQAVAANAVGALAVMAEAGWLQQSAKREKLITFARDGKHREALAWLMDYKNRTADVAAEAEREERKLMQELTQDPNSAAAMKKLWSTKKLPDGTLAITSYKGSEEAITVPAQIGKTKVTVIAEYAFSCWADRCKNRDEREKIRSVTVPEGITTIEDKAFCACYGLESVTLPASLERVGSAAFWNCDHLRDVTLGSEKTLLAWNAFLGCDALCDAEGFLIVSGILFRYRGKETAVTIPEGVHTIADKAFCPNDRNHSSLMIETLTLPQSLTRIGESAFEKMSSLRAITIPAGVKHLGKRALYDCGKLRDVYLPAGLKKLGAELIGSYDDNINWDAKHPARGVIVHTPSGSAAEAYMREHYPDTVTVANDFDA